MSAKTLAKKGVVVDRGMVVIVAIKEVAPEQIALTMENSAVIKNIADATDVSNFSPIRRNIFDSMLP